MYCYCAVIINHGKDKCQQSSQKLKLCGLLQGGGGVVWGWISCDFLFTVSLKKRK